MAEEEKEKSVFSDVFTVFTEKDLERLEYLFMLEEMRRRDIEDCMMIP